MKFTNVIDALYCQPWLINRQLHARLCDMLQAKITEGKMFDGEDGDSGKASKDAYPIRYVGSTAIVSLKGIIARHASAMWESCGFCSLERFKRQMKEAAANAMVTRIIIDCDSPGGQAQGTPEAADLVASISKQKDVLAFCEGQSCSAAYYICSQAGSGIFVTKSSAIGCVGTYIALMDSSRQYEQAGLKAIVIKAGKFKGLGEDGTQITDEQIALLQATIDRSNGRFTGAVKSARPGVTDEMLQGQWFDGEDCITNGLADGLVTDLGDLVGQLNSLNPTDS